MLREEENGIIAKSVLSRNLMSNDPFHSPSYNLGTSVWKCCSNSAYESCCALLIRHAIQAVKQRLILYILGSILPHISGGIDSRLLIEIVDFQSGIIRQH